MPGLESRSFLNNKTDFITIQFYKKNNLKRVAVIEWEVVFYIVHLKNGWFNYKNWTWKKSPETWTEPYVDPRLKSLIPLSDFEERVKSLEVSSSAPVFNLQLYLSDTGVWTVHGPGDEIMIDQNDQKVQRFSWSKYRLLE